MMLQMPTKRKVMRQEMRWLSEVPSGTPKRLATVMPAIMMETASELLPLSASREATMEATPK